MRWAPSNQKRVLAIDPWTRGFGYAVLEGPDCLVDWGVKGAKESKNTRCVNLIARLVDDYAPDVIVLEECSNASCRRRERARDLIFLVLKLAAARKIRAVTVSRRDLHRAFPSLKIISKHGIATTLGERFPQLQPLVPPYRKPWMSEDCRMAIFDAVAFAEAYFRSRERRRLNIGRRQSDESSVAA